MPLPMTLPLTTIRSARQAVHYLTFKTGTAMTHATLLENFAISGATLAIHLAIRNMREIERVLIPHYGADCPVVVAYRASWPDQIIIRGTLSDIRKKVRDAKITRTALILVGPALKEQQDFVDSALYHPDMEHVLRNRKTPAA